MSNRPNLPLIERVAENLRAEIGDDDADAFLDTLDGETDAVEIADSLIAALHHDEALAAAAKEQSDALARRSRRLGDRARAKKRTLLSVLDAMGVRKLERPAATVSRRATVPSAYITDAAAIPSQLTRTRTEPDKVEILRQLRAGENVPGAELVQGPDTISVRAE